MIDHDLAGMNVEKARQLTVCLSGWRLPSELKTGDLVADLSDLYAAAVHYQRILDKIIETPPGDDERLSSLLADLSVELQHIADHAGSAHPSVDAIAESFD